MKARRLVTLAAAAALVAARAHANDAGQAMPASPAAVETAPPAVPFTVRQDDAELFLRRAAPAAKAAPAAGGGGRTETLALTPAPVANQSSRFVFIDVTDRPLPYVRSLPERQAAVEAVRRSLRRTGGSGDPEAAE